MILERPVLMADGTVLDHHEATCIYQAIGSRTTIEVRSWGTASGEGGNVPERTTRLELDYADGMTERGAYDYVSASPEFAEWVDPEQAALDALIPTLSDEQAELAPQLFPSWDVGVAYSVGDRVRYGGVLWRCVQAHASQEGWEPGVALSLWVRTTPEGTVPEWVQPTGSHDAYAAGDHVMHGGAEWVSLVDGNVWEPGATGTESLWSRA